MLILGLFMFAIQFTDNHTYGNPQEVRPTHLSLDLTLDFEKKVIQGSCLLDLEYVDPTRKVADLFLDLSRISVQSVTADGKALEFSMDLDRDYMGQRLHILLGDSQPKKVMVRYTTDPGAGAVQWLAPQQTTSGRFPFLFTQSQSILARSWIPCMDSPGVRVTYDAVVRVPPGMTAVMSAEQGEHDTEKGIFRFHLKQAIPPYLIALAAGELAFKPISDRTGVYAEPAVVDKAAWEFADMEKMVRATEELYGAYAWGRWDTIVLPPSFPFGGMENPLLTFATPTVIAGDRSLVSLMAHELAHSWSGNLVTNATWSDFWLNEGFTTYIERRIVESVYGVEIAEMQKLLGQRDLRQTHVGFEKEEPEFNKLHNNLDGRDPDDGFSDIPYEKGANFLLVLENHFGREKFDTFVKQYFAAFAFQSITTEVFLDFLDKNLLKGDAQLRKQLKVDEWIFAAGIPDNMVIPKSNKFQLTRAAATAFAATGSLEGVKKGTWVTAEWLDFINNLPVQMNELQMTKLDQELGFTKAGNSEILFAWMLHAIRNNYQPAYDSLEHFLKRQGRRKFLKPLYQALMDNPQTRDLAKKIYASAKTGYHPIAVSAIDAIVK